MGGAHSNAGDAEPVAEVVDPASIDRFEIILNNLIEREETVSDSLENDEQRVHVLLDRLYTGNAESQVILDALDFSSIRMLRDVKPDAFMSIFEAVLENLATVATEGNLQSHLKLVCTRNCIRALTRLVCIMNEDITCDVSKSLLDKGVATKSVQVLANLLFCGNFTIKANWAALAEKIEVPDGQSPESASAEELARIWEHESIDTADIFNFDSNRSEVLRALLACFSLDLFTVPASFSHDSNPMLRYWATSIDYAYPGSAQLRPLVVFRSLINVVLNYQPNFQSGISSVIPYAHSFTLTDYAPREELVDLSLQVLLVSFECFSPPEHPDPLQNRYLLELSRVKRTKKLAVMFDRLLGFLEDNIRYQSAYLPESMKDFMGYQEVLVLLWRALEHNEAFFKYVSESSDSNRFVRVLLYYMYISRSNPTYIGMLHTCALSLLRLSTSRDFAIALNKPYLMDLPIRMGMFKGTFVDFLLLVTHDIIAEPSQHVTALYQVVVTIYHNLSPFFKAMAFPSCVNLINLFKRFTQKRFLAAAPENYQFAIGMIEVFNNVIQYQYIGNDKLVATLIRNANLFYELHNFAESGSKMPQVEDKSEVAVDPEGPAKESTKENEKEPINEVFKQVGKEPSDESVEVVNESVKEVRSEEATENSVVDRLPLGTIFALLEYSIPKLQELAKRGALDNDHQLLVFVRELTVVGVLPAPHRLLVRRYTSSPYTLVWFTTYIWGTVFLRNSHPQLFDHSTIKLFSCSVSA